MRYSLTTLHREFPDNTACLDFIFKTRYPHAKGYSRIRGKKEYVNSKGHHISPLAGTIFHKSRTPLTLWFHAIFLFYVSKNGISAAELSRQLGMTYKCAFRIGHQIRKAMTQDDIPLSGIVEADETYVGGRHAQAMKFRKKSVVFGMVERKGKARIFVVPHRGTEMLLPKISQHVEKGSHMMTDEAQVYKKIPRIGFRHSYVKHGKRNYVRGDVHVNSCEGFWGLLKPSLTGTYRGVSKGYLQKYIDEFVWKYNWRDIPAAIAFPELIVSIAISGS